MVWWAWSGRVVSKSGQLSQLTIDLQYRKYTFVITYPQTLRGARFAIVDFVHHNWFHDVHQNMFFIVIYRSTWTI